MVIIGVQDFFHSMKDQGRSDFDKFLKTPPNSLRKGR